MVVIILVCCIPGILKGSPISMGVALGALFGHYVISTILPAIAKRRILSKHRAEIERKVLDEYMKG